MLKSLKKEFAMTIGRPALFTPEMANAICDRLINGESLRSICRDETVPHQATAFRWIASDEHSASNTRAHEGKRLHCSCRTCTGHCG
ncbi:hypothetical protein [Nitrosospira sp. Nsp13]|uniref:terminase small subunit-like protein n=1 Tax=Nitrosospira sp. Nsp13 TaxID=1855332 RepID=UPI0034A55149